MPRQVELEQARDLVGLPEHVMNAIHRSGDVEPNPRSNHRTANIPKAGVNPLVVDVYATRAGRHNLAVSTVRFHVTYHRPRLNGYHPTNPVGRFIEQDVSGL